MDNEELIQQAGSVIRTRKNGDHTIGDVGAALVTDKGNVYLGVCIDTNSSMGFCAEHNAIGAMVTAGESRINKIVAIWKNEKDEAQVLSPCGRCREFIFQIDNNNRDTEVILADKTIPLRELLPYRNWDTD